MLNVSGLGEAVIPAPPVPVPLLPTVRLTGIEMDDPLPLVGVTLIVAE